MPSNCAASPDAKSTAGKSIVLVGNSGTYQVQTSLGCLRGADVFTVSCTSPEPSEDARKLIAKRYTGSKAIEDADRVMYIAELLGPHPNLVPVIDAAREGCRSLWIIQEEVHSLQDKLTELHRSPLDQRIPLMMDSLFGVLTGLQCIHEAGLAHGDLKPSNIILREALVQLGNFCERFDALRCPREGRNTLRFAAPEVLNRESTSSPAADVWALGCCIVEMAGEALPSFAGHRKYWPVLRLEGEKSLVASHLRDLCGKCLARDAGSRPSVATLLCHPLFHGLAPPLERPKPSPVSQSRKLQQSLVLLIGSCSPKQELLLRHHLSLQGNTELVIVSNTAVLAAFARDIDASTQSIVSSVGENVHVSMPEQRSKLASVHASRCIIVPPKWYKKFDAQIVSAAVAKHPHRLLCVMTHSDAHTPLVDWLNELYDIRWTDPRTSELRCDKHKMQGELKAAGMLTPETYCVTSPEQAAEVAKQYFLAHPTPTRRLPDPQGLVLKPSRGAGSEHLHVCHSSNEVKEAYEQLMETDLPGVSSMVLQERMKEHEFVVNTVSVAGEAIVTDVWFSKKEPVVLAEPYRRETFLYNTQTFLPHCFPPSDESVSTEEAQVQFAASVAVEFAFQCLQVLGMIYGAGHCEVMVELFETGTKASLSQRKMGRYTAEPRLIELNPRLAGDVPRAGSIVGYDQPSLLAYSLHRRLNPMLLWPPTGVPVLYDISNKPAQLVHELARSRCDELLYPGQRKPEQSSTVLAVFLCSPTTATVNPGAFRFIDQLRTFLRFARSDFTDGCKVVQTVDLRTSPAAVILQGPLEECLRDEVRIRKLETNSMKQAGTTELTSPLHPLYRRRSLEAEALRLLTQEERDEVRDIGPLYFQAESQVQEDPAKNNNCLPSSKPLSYAEQPLHSIAVA